MTLLHGFDHDLGRGRPRENPDGLVDFVPRAVEDEMVGVAEPHARGSLEERGSEDVHSLDRHG